MIVMLRRFSTYEFGVAEATHLCLKIAFVAVAILFDGECRFRSTRRNQGLGRS
jgi:hypothetical protein